jgi:FAD/FMN-containing dehydrogenase
MARRVQRPVATVDDAPFPIERPWEGFPAVAEAACPPSKVGEALTGDGWGALAGVGIVWLGLDGGERELGQLRSRVHAVGGIAPIVLGAGGLGDSPVAAPDVHRRLKAAFDPNGVLAPGREWETSEG